jgi:hypothetical protein
MMLICITRHFVISVRAVKWMKLRWAGRVSQMGETGNAYKILVKNLLVTGHLEDRGRYWGLIWKWSTGKWVMRIWKNWSDSVFRPTWVLGISVVEASNTVTESQWTWFAPSLFPLPPPPVVNWDCRQKVVITYICQVFCEKCQTLQAVSEHLTQ